MFILEPFCYIQTGVLDCIDSIVDGHFAYVGQEGGDGGVLAPATSLVFAALEVCLCLLVRQVPTGLLSDERSQ